MRTRRIKSGALVALLVLALGACEFRRGPDPTAASIAATTGPFATETFTVAAGNGFGGGTIYAPTDTSQGLFGAVAVAPGFLTKQDTMSWYGPRIASQGFVVLTIDTNSTYDQPDSRATQLLAALDWLTGSSSPVSARVDPSRLAVLGWSMGGGGALRAGVTRPSLKAVVGVAPWNNSPDFSSLAVPTLVVACQNDTVAPVDQQASPIYESISTSVDKEYLEIAGGEHFCVTTGTASAVQKTAIGRQVIAFLKRFVDGDTRYAPFVCPMPAVDSVVSEVRSSCPF